MVDACVDDNMAVWALWARPPGGLEGGFGGISSYGGDGSLNAVHHDTIDEVSRWTRRRREGFEGWIRKRFELEGGEGRGGMLRSCFATEASR